MTLVTDAPVSPVNQTEIQVYSTAGCVQCSATYRKLDEYKVPYRVIDVSEDPNAAEKLKELGYTQAPVVFDGFEHWSGYQPEKLANAAAKRMYTAETLF
jgi:glutaredoxin-like protein NrdH